MHYSHSEALNVALGYNSVTQPQMCPGGYLADFNETIP